MSLNLLSLPGDHPDLTLGEVTKTGGLLSEESWYGILGISWSRSPNYSSKGLQIIGLMEIEES